MIVLQEVIAHVPPHWKDGLVREHGERWAGAVRQQQVTMINFINSISFPQALTIDSRVSEVAPPRNMFREGL